MKISTTGYCAIQIFLLPAAISWAQIRGWSDDAAFMENVERGQVAEVRSFLEQKRINLNEIRDGYSQTPLMIAARAEQPEMLKLLLRYGADVDARDNFGETALIKAATSGIVSGIETLLAAGANIEARNSIGQTAFRQSAA